MRPTLAAMNAISFLAVGAGSFLGGMARYGLSALLLSRWAGAFPVGTMAVNLLGCLAIGVVYGLFERAGVGTSWRLFAITGILGGFTTFSAFGLETVQLMRLGNLAYAGIYVVASVGLGLVATFAGLLAVR